MLLIPGAGSVLQSAKDKTDALSRWAVQLANRVGYWKAVVAIAAKNARMCWAILRRGEDFKSPIRVRSIDLLHRCPLVVSLSAPFAQRLALRQARSPTRSPRRDRGHYLLNRRG